MLTSVLESSRTCTFIWDLSELQAYVYCRAVILYDATAVWSLLFGLKCRLKTNMENDCFKVLNSHLRLVLLVMPVKPALSLLLWAWFSLLSCTYMQSLQSSKNTLLNMCSNLIYPHSQKGRRTTPSAAMIRSDCIWDWWSKSTRNLLLWKSGDQIDFIFKHGKKKQSCTAFQFVALEPTTTETLGSNLHLLH